MLSHTCFLTKKTSTRLQICVCRLILTKWRRYRLRKAAILCLMTSMRQVLISLYTVFMEPDTVGVCTYTQMYVQTLLYNARSANPFRVHGHCRVYRTCVSCTSTETQTLFTILVNYAYAF